MSRQSLGSPNVLRAWHYLYNDAGAPVADPESAGLYTDPGTNNLTADIRFVITRTVRAGDLSIVTEVAASKISWRRAVHYDRDPNDILEPGSRLQLRMTYTLTNIVTD